MKSICLSSAFRLLISDFCSPIISRHCPYVPCYPSITSVYRCRKRNHMRWGLARLIFDRAHRMDAMFTQTS